MHDAGTIYMGTLHAPPEALADIARVTNCMQRMVEAIGMRPLGSLVLDVPQAIARLGGEVECDEGGLSVVVVLSTSHAAIHTWPEESAARFAIDSCREFDTRIVPHLFMDLLGATAVFGSNVAPAAGIGSGR